MKIEAISITAASPVTGPAAIGGANVRVPICRVEGEARPATDSRIRFEVWLPSAPSAWSGRLKVSGTGGFAGAIPYASLAQDVGDGFVSAGSNMGHDGGESAAWTLNHPEQVRDWGLRAHYWVTTAAKALTTTYYGRPAQHAYFEGCSNGGRQAMMMAQNYPELFDGIVAGAPSMFYPDLLFWLLWSGKQQIPVAGQPPVLSDALRTRLTQRVLAACDGLDGLVDGQITNPRACRMDVASLGPEGDRTLTASELSVLRGMRAGTASESGAPRFPGVMPGSESSWIPMFADNGGYGRFIEHFVYGRHTPEFDWRSRLNFSDAYDKAKAALTPFTAAPSPDISAFTARGGKLLQFHGWNDAVVPPGSSIAYWYALTQFDRLKGLTAPEFDRAVAQLTPAQLDTVAEAGLDKLGQHYRLFMLPAMAHCGQESAGPSAIGGGAQEPPAHLRNADHHAMSAVIRWVEQGIAPERIIATKFGPDGKVLRQRPVCPYPQQAAYRGKGDIDTADNFSCQTPKASDRAATEMDLLLVQQSLRQRDMKSPNR